MFGSLVVPFIRCCCYMIVLHSFVTARPQDCPRECARRGTRPRRLFDSPTSLAATILHFTSLVRSRLIAPARTVSLPVRRFTLPTAPLAMPSKRTSSKRAAVDEVTAANEDKEVQAKAEEDSPLSELSGSEKEEAPKKKRAKKPPVTPLDPSVPTNKEVPEDLSPFPRPPEGCVRISAWNVAGLRASEKKGALLILLAAPESACESSESSLTPFSSSVQPSLTPFFSSVQASRDT